MTVAAMLSQMTVTGMPDSLQLVGGDAAALEERAGFVGVDVESDALLMGRGRWAQGRCRRRRWRAPPALQWVRRLSPEC